MTETIGRAQWCDDLDALLPLPAVPYDTERQAVLTRELSSLKVAGRATRHLRRLLGDHVWSKNNGHREALTGQRARRRRGGLISCGTDVIARHRRSYDYETGLRVRSHPTDLPLGCHGREVIVMRWTQAAPLAGWLTLPRASSARCASAAGCRGMGRRGKREFVQVHQAQMETFSIEEAPPRMVRDADA